MLSIDVCIMIKHHDLMNHGPNPIENPAILAILTAGCKWIKRLGICIHFKLGETLARAVATNDISFDLLTC